MTSVMSFVSNALRGAGSTLVQLVTGKPQATNYEHVFEEYDGWNAICAAPPPTHLVTQTDVDYVELRRALTNS